MANYIENFSSKLDWAMPFQRTGKFPLDRTDLFGSYADAVKYAAGNTSDPDSRGLCGSSYVGQIITVFENDTVTVYKIEADRSLSEVGKSTLGDEKTIDLADGTLSLHNFGKQYYRWVEAVGVEGQEGYVAGHHELQVVDESNPWISGLEPKVVSRSGGGFELAWYQPSNTTVEELGSTVSTVVTDVQTAQQDIADLQTQLGNDGSDGNPKTGLYKEVQDVADELGTSADVGMNTAWSQINANKDDIAALQARNDFTNAYKTKLEGIEDGAEKNVQSDWNQVDDTADDFIKNKPTTLAGYGITDVAIADDGKLTVGSKTIDPVVKEAGKSLISDDLITKISDLDPNAEANVQADWNEADINADSYIKNKPTTIAGYGITDAKIDAGVITLGENTIEPVVKTAGKDLSSNDFTNELKAKLEGVEAGSQKNVQSDWNATEGDALILNKPSKLSDFTDDISEGILTQVTTDLENYYKKTETYSKEEVNNLISPLHSINISVVDSLPQSDIDLYTIYLVRKGDNVGDIYYEYLYINGSWEVLGSTEVNLDGYAKTADLAMVATTGEYSDLQNKPMVVTKTSQTLAANSTTVSVSYTGSLVNYIAKDATTGEIVITEVDVADNAVTFTIAQVYANDITCDVFALA